jgi:hypothetical protein
VNDDHRAVVGHQGRQLQSIAGSVRTEDQGHGSVFVQCIRVVSHVAGVCQSVSYVVVADPMMSGRRFDPQVGFRHQGIVPRNSYERPSPSREGTTRYTSGAVRPSSRYGGRRARGVIRSIVLATVSRDQADPHETILAWTIATVKTGAPPPAPNASTAATTSSRQVGMAGLRSPR